MKNLTDFKKCAKKHKIYKNGHKYINCCDGHYECQYGAYIIKTVSTKKAAINFLES